MHEVPVESVFEIAKSLEFAVRLPPSLSAANMGEDVTGNDQTEADRAADIVGDRKSDPRQALDAVKRATVVALVRLGASRRMAAAEVGCSHRTIARTAARDSEFAADLAEAESRADGKALRLIDRATDQEKYWRAAAWVLERRNPEEFGRREPNTFTPDEMMKHFTRFLHNALPKLPAECRDVLLEEYEDVLSDLTGDPDAEVDRKKFEVKEENHAKNDVLIDEAPVPAPPLLEKECPRDETAARAWTSVPRDESLGYSQVPLRGKGKTPFLLPFPITNELNHANAVALPQKKAEIPFSTSWQGRLQRFRLTNQFRRPTRRPDIRPLEPRP